MGDPVEGQAQPRRDGPHEEGEVSRHAEEEYRRAVGDRQRAGPGDHEERAAAEPEGSLGFTVVTAMHANWFLDSYVYGYALQEASLPFDSSEEFAEMSEDVYLPQLPPEQFPYLNESAAVLAATGYDPAEEFGLDLVLRALDGLRKAEQGSAPPA